MCNLNVSVLNFLPPAGHRGQKVISPASYSGEVFFSDASLQSPSHPTGASAFVSSPDSGKLKHSHSCSKITSKGLKPHKSSSSSSNGSSSGGRGGGGRALSSVEETGEWAAKLVKTLSSASPKSTNFYKRTRDPKKPEELSSKAKEQHRNPKKTEGQGLKESVGGSRAKTSPTSPGTFPQAPVLRTDPRLEPLHRSADSQSRPSLKGPENRTGPEEGGRTRPGLQQDRQAEPHRISSSRHPRQTHTARHSSGKDSRLSQTPQRSGEPRSAGTHAEEALLSSDGRRRTAGSPASSTDANIQQHKLFHSKEAGKKRLSSVNSIPDTLAAIKAPVGPGPWRVPSSAKILSEAEALRDPL